MGCSRFQDLGSCKTLTGLSAETEAGGERKREKKKENERKEKKGKATKRDPSATQQQR